MNPESSFSPQPETLRTAIYLAVRQLLHRTIEPEEANHFALCRLPLALLQNRNNAPAYKTYLTAIDDFIGALEKGSLPQSQNALRLLMQSLAALQIHQEENDFNASSLALLRSLFNEMQMMRGEGLLVRDLFSPDLTIKPELFGTPQALTPEDYKTQLTQARARFQRGLLLFLKNTDSLENAFSELLGAVERIESVVISDDERAFWSVVAGFLMGICEGARLGDLDALKKWCSRIDRQIKTLIDQGNQGNQANQPNQPNESNQHKESSINEPLFCDTLFLVARVENPSSPILRLREVYKLPDNTQSTEIAFLEEAPEGQHLFLYEMGSILLAAEDAWNKLCAGSIQLLPYFCACTQSLVAIADQLGNTDFRRLIKVISTVAHWIENDRKNYSEALALELSCALLLAKKGWHDFGLLGAEFVEQVDWQVLRLHAYLAGDEPQNVNTPSQSALFIEAQEALRVRKIAKKVQRALNAIARAISDLRISLESVETSFAQVISQFILIHQEAAANHALVCQKEFLAARNESASHSEKSAYLEEQIALLDLFTDCLPCAIYGKIGEANSFAAFTKNALPLVQTLIKPTAQKTIENLSVKEETASKNAVQAPEQLAEKDSEIPPKAAPEIPPEIPFNTSLKLAGIAPITPNVKVEEASKPQQKLSFSPALIDLFEREASRSFASLNALRQKMEALPETPLVPEGQSAIAALSSIAGMANYVHTQKLCTALEHTLARHDTSRKAASPEAALTIYKAFDELALIFAALAEQNPEPEVSKPLISALEVLYFF